MEALTNISVSSGSTDDASALYGVPAINCGTNGIGRSFDSGLSINIALTTYSLPSSANANPTASGICVSPMPNVSSICPTCDEAICCACSSLVGVGVGEGSGPAVSTALVSGCGSSSGVGVVAGSSLGGVAATTAVATSSITTGVG